VSGPRPRVTAAASRATSNDRLAMHLPVHPKPGSAPPAARTQRPTNPGVPPRARAAGAAASLRPEAGPLLADPLVDRLQSRDHCADVLVAPPRLPQDVVAPLLQGLEVVRRRAQAPAG